MASKGERNALKRAEIAALPQDIEELFDQIVREVEVDANLSPVGRKPKLNAALIRIIYRAFERGLTTDTVAHISLVHPDTLRKWRRERPSFDLLVNQAIARGHMHLAGKAYDLADGGNVNMIKYLLARKVPGFQSAPIMDRVAPEAEDGSIPRVVGFQFVEAIKPEKPSDKEE